MGFIMKTIVCNDFSLEMLSENCTINIDRISSEDFTDIISNVKYINRIGNKDIANALGLEFNKGQISLNEDTRLIVAKLVGGELSENFTALPSNLEFKFFDIKYYEGVVDESHKHK